MKNIKVISIGILGIVCFIIVLMQVKIAFDKKEIVNKIKNSQKIREAHKRLFEAKIDNYKREVFAPYQGEISIEINPFVRLGKFTVEQFAEYRMQKVSMYQQLNIFPLNYNPLKYPHNEIYKRIGFGTEWTEAAEKFISNPYLFVTLSAASYIEPMETYCQLTKVQYKNGVIEEKYCGPQASRFFQIFDLNFDVPGAVRIWVVNAQDAGLIYSTVDKEKCENIDFTWRNTPDNIANSIYSINTVYNVGQYQKNNISPDCRRSTLKIKNKGKYTSIYVKLWINKPKSQKEREEFAYIIKVIP